MSTARQVKLLADTLDSQGKVDAPIVVVGSRANLRSEFSPVKRGGPLRFREHELVLVPRTKEPGPLPNLDLFEDEPA